MLSQGSLSGLLLGDHSVVSGQSVVSWWSVSGQLAADSGQSVPNGQLPVCVGGL